MVGKEGFEPPMSVDDWFTASGAAVAQLTHIVHGYGFRVKPPFRALATLGLVMPTLCVPPPYHVAQRVSSVPDMSAPHGLQAYMVYLTGFEPVLHGPKPRALPSYAIDRWLLVLDSNQRSLGYEPSGDDRSPNVQSNGAYCITPLGLLSIEIPEKFSCAAHQLLSGPIAEPFTIYRHFRA